MGAVFGARGHGGAGSLMPLIPRGLLDPAQGKCHGKGDVWPGVPSRAPFFGRPPARLKRTARLLQLE
jgi:hypothetical protein